MTFITLDERQLNDFELITDGSFYPLDGFMTYENYISCLEKMTINNGKDFFPLPIVLHITEEIKTNIENEKTVILKHETGLELGEMLVESIFEIDLMKEIESLVGYYDKNHPHIEFLEAYISLGYKYYVGGKIIRHNKVPHYDFNEYRLTPFEMKEFIKEKSWKNVIGFQTRNPMHISHIELTYYALNEVEESNLFLHPVVGQTQIGDIDYVTRVKCYKEILKYYNSNEVKLGLLPLCMKMCGPKEALLHALIRKNYGCTHFIVGRDHAGPSVKNSKGESFYAPYDAQEMMTKYADIIGIKPIFSKEIVYVTSTKSLSVTHKKIDDVKSEYEVIHRISGTEFRRRLRENEKIPEWFSDKNVVEILRSTVCKGFCVYFIGLSGSGKSTMAKFLESKLKEMTNRPITILDGDIIRQNISKGLGFSLEDRSTNVQRIGFVASEIVKHNGICIVANIAPLKKDRLINKLKISKTGGKYIEVFMNTSLEVCENRDTKNLYSKARAGLIKDFTGISSPFEDANESDIMINGSNEIKENLNTILNYLLENKIIEKNL